MAPTPTPSNEVPEFIVDRFADHSPEELRSIAEYAETGTHQSVEGTVPKYVRQAFTIQDDETVAACAIYAFELAEAREQTAAEAAEAAEKQAATDGGTSDQDAPIRGGSFFG